MKILYGIIGLILVAGGVWYATSMTPTETETVDANTENMNSDAPSTEAMNFKGSLQGLVARGGSWQCEVSVTTEGVTTKGTSYIASGMVRTDFVSTVPQYGEIESHMIMRDSTVYTWSNLMPQGMKFPIVDGTMGGARSSTEVTPQFDGEYDYTCKAWPTDESKFALPTDITF